MYYEWNFTKWKMKCYENSQETTWGGNVLPSHSQGDNRQTEIDVINKAQKVYLLSGLCMNWCPNWHKILETNVLPWKAVKNLHSSSYISCGTADSFLFSKQLRDVVVSQSSHQHYCFCRAFPLAPYASCSRCYSSQYLEMICTDYTMLHLCIKLYKCTGVGTGKRESAWRRTFSSFHSIFLLLSR